MGFIATDARALIQILFQRGHFDQQAAALSGQVMEVYTWTLWSSMTSAPILKVFQITDRIRLTAWAYLTGAAATCLSGYLLVFVLGYGLFGFTLTVVIASYSTCFAVALLLRRCECRISWLRIAGYCAFAAAVALASATALRLFPVFGTLWLDFFVRAAGYGVMVALGYCLIWKRLRAIILG